MNWDSELIYPKGRLFVNCLLKIELEEGWQFLFTATPKDYSFSSGTKNKASWRWGTGTADSSIDAAGSHLCCLSETDSPAPESRADHLLNQLSLPSSWVSLAHSLPHFQLSPFHTALWIQKPSLETDGWYGIQLPKHEDLILFGLSKGIPHSLLPLQMGNSIPRMLICIGIYCRDEGYPCLVATPVDRCTPSPASVAGSEEELQPSLQLYQKLFKRWLTNDPHLG